MLNNLFQGVFDSGTVSAISVGDFFLCLFCSLIIGLILVLMYMR